MDANGTRFHLLLGRDDWTACRCAPRADAPDAAVDPRVGDAGASAEWDDASQEVTLRRRGFRFTSAPRNVPPDLDAQRRDAAADMNGNWYWIDADGERICVRSAGSQRVSEFWPVEESESRAAGAFAPAAPSAARATAFAGLAVTADHYLVVGTRAPAGFLVFDLFAGGGPRQFSWPDDVAFVPFDFAAGPDCGVWMLDRERRQYWILDRSFNVAMPGPALAAPPTDAQAFQPLAPEATAHAIEPRVATDFARGARPVPAADPLAIAVARDGTVMVLDAARPPERFSTVHVLRDEQWSAISLQSMEGSIALEARAAFSLHGYDMAFVDSRGEGDALGAVYVAEAGGDQAYHFTLVFRAGAFDLVPVPEYLPMRRFGGKGLAVHDGQVHYDFAQAWVALVSQPRPRFQDESVLRTGVLDGKEPDCVWHRLQLDACIPPGTTVAIWTRAANEPALLEASEWQAEPRPYLHDDSRELPFAPAPWGRRDPREARALGDGTWELLLQRARGRYLQVRIALAGSERNSPRLRAMRVHYPRFSYLKEYLPAVYREDAASSQFLEGFLANLEGIYTGIEDRIASAHVLLDACSAPREALAWLASWLGAALDPAWNEERRRLFIRKAMLYYRYRGTAHGLRMALALALDEDIDESLLDLPERAPEKRFGVRIVEKYLTRNLPDVLFGDPAQLEAPSLDDATPWKPQDGTAALRRRYARFLGVPDSPLPEFPLVAPAEPEAAGRWAQFAEAVLGFTPWAAALEREAWQGYLAATYGDLDALNRAWGTDHGDYSSIELPADQPPASPRREDWAAFMRLEKPSRTPAERHRWQALLRSRHGTVSVLDAKYGQSWESLDLVPLPDRLPADGPALEDWFQFEGAVLAIAGTAHRFTVLLPMPTGDAVSPLEPRRRLDLATRIVNLEKPAHTVFDVRFYWAMFRVGEARLGLDTQVEKGAREQLIPALVLGQGYVGEGHVAPTEVEKRADRLILGRDPRLH